MMAFEDKMGSCRRCCYACNNLLLSLCVSPLAAILRCEEVCLFVECIDIIISDKASLQVSEPCGAGFESFDFCMFTQHIHWVSVVWHISSATQA